MDNARLNATEVIGLNRRFLLVLLAAVAFGVVAMLAVRSLMPGRRTVVALNADAGSRVAPPAPPVAATPDAGAEDAGAEVGGRVPLVPLPPRTNTEPRDRKPRVDTDVQPTPKPTPTPFVPVVPVVPAPKLVDAGPPPVADAGVVRDAGPAPKAVAPAALSAARTPLKLAVKDELGTWLKLITVEISIDGKKLVSKADIKGIQANPELVMHEGDLFPGTHSVSARLVYKGAGGVFGYLEGYTFRPSASGNFEAKEGGTVKVIVVGADRGATYEFEKRPMIKLVVVP